ncbi:MAG TPA: hypothetical protein VKT72_11125 [Candidatus Baltobacteraceae bacterium]|nr:hypothetical protein [Candidatus Baltobacteraceae bacterium]
MADEHRIVSIVTFAVTTDTLEPVARELGLVLERRVMAIPGFIEGMVLCNEKRTQVDVISVWSSSHTWASAQWDEDIARALGDVFEETASYKLEFFEPVKVVHAGGAGH